MGLIVKIGANLKDFDKEMKKLTREVNTVGDKLKGAGAKLTGAVTLPIVAMGTAATITGMNFEAAMSKVAAISGATGDDLQALEKKAREMGATTQYSATEAAEAFSYMSMAGWKTEDMLSGIDGIMSLAAASGEDLAKTSDIVTDALTAFGMTAGDSGRFADVLAAASSNANTNVSLLGESFKEVAPLAGAMGYSAEDVSTALGLMANAGIKGSSAGTALKNMMANMASPTKAMKGAMDELGLSLTNNDGTMKTLDQVMQDLRSSFDGLDETQQAAYASTIFGKEAMSGALAVINASESDYNKLSDAIENSEGSAKEMADTMNNNLSGKLKEMKSAFEEMGLVIYESLKPALEAIVSAIKSLADWFNGLSPKMQQLIIGFAAIAAAIGPLLFAVGTGIILFGQLKAALAVLKLSFLAVSWPILAVIAALAAIVAIVVYWDEIKAFFIALWATLKQVFSSAMEAISAKCSGVWNAIRDYFKEIWDSISASTSEAWNAIKDFFARIWNSIWTTIEPIVMGIANFIKGAWDLISKVTSSVWNFIKQYLKAIWDALKLILTPVFEYLKKKVTDIWNNIKAVTSTVWNAIKATLTTIWNNIKAAVTPIFDFLKNTIKRIWDSIKSTSSTVWNAIKTTVTSIWESIKTTASNVWNKLKSTIMTPVNYVKDKVGAAFNGMKSTALGAWEGLKSGMKTVINGIIKLVNKFIGGFNGPAKLLNKLPGVSAPIIPDIPMLATGGNVFGTGNAIVGEAGPELLQKSGSSVKVTPLSSQEKAGGIGGALGGGGVYELNVSIPLDGRELVRRTVRFTAEELQKMKVSPGRGVYG